MKVERVNTTDHEILTEITKQSKAYWGYSIEQLLQWNNLLTITKDYIASNQVFKLVIDNKTIGYYAYFNLEENSVKLDNLFILPEYIGKGFGKYLMTDFLTRVKNEKFKKITLDSEPNAEDFLILCIYTSEVLTAFAN